MVKKGDTFVSAKQLKTEFIVFGHFFEIKINPTTRIKCRSVLEIVCKEFCQTPGEEQGISNHRPDAIFIMMNPSSSKPLGKIKNKQIIPRLEIHNLQTVLVPTKPDKTQYQLMRVMKQKSWEHVRVLNLSDIRERRSQEFYKKLRKLSKTEPNFIHSCFSDLRTKELQSKLTIDNPIYAAWGVANDLQNLIQLCKSKLNSNTNLLGIKKYGTNSRYYHPLIRNNPFSKRKWLEIILKQS